ncbi:ankyrin repeat-containing domain protein [Xylogone sp. PMI_703]|nr:ankyrin repeat-containing domain protein [Xylogone sp. PMI_703]
MLQAGVRPTETSTKLAIQTNDINILSRLLDAGAMSTETLLKAAISVEDISMVSYLLSAGAKPTGASMEIARRRDIITCLLNAGAPLSAETAEYMLRQDYGLGWIEDVLQKRQDSVTKGVILCAAISSGATSVVEHILKNETPDFLEIIAPHCHLTQAIENCCCRGYADTFRSLLDRGSKYRFLISEWLGNSVFLAVSNSDEEILNLLLSAGADINNTMALTKAIQDKNKNMFEVLIQRGAKLNQEIYCRLCGLDRISGWPLVAAIEWGDESVIDTLLASGADIDALKHYVFGDGCRSPLTTAILKRNRDLVYRLIHLGAVVNNPIDFPNHHTSLSAAIHIGDLQLARFLINAGADLHDVIAIKIASRDLSKLQFLVGAVQTSGCPSARKRIGKRALQAAAKRADEPMVQWLLNSNLPDIDSTTVLSRALFEALTNNSNSRSSAIIRMILRSGEIQNTIWRVKREAGAKPDHNQISELEHSPLQLAVMKKDEESVRTLLSYGANPNAMPRYAKTQTNKIAAKCRMISHSHFQKKWYARKIGEYADINKKTPIQIAVQNRHVEMVKLLLISGANPDLPFSNSHHTPLQWASINGDKDMVELLLEYGASVNSFQGAVYSRGTALQFAIMGSHLEIAQLLLDNGADVNAPPEQENGATALQAASVGGFLGLAYLLLEKGAHVNAPPAKIGGRTALEGAAEHGRIDMVQLLINYGADVRGEPYERALERASRSGHHSLRRLLESYRQ